MLWHLMKYYAHWGHTDFILCLGYRGEVIRDYFVSQGEWRPDDSIAPGGKREGRLLGHDRPDWCISFVDTGQDANVGERLLAVRGHLRGETMFLANYADGLSDYPLPLLIQRAARKGVSGAFLAVRPNTSFHFVDYASDGTVLGLHAVEDTELRINGGFFVFRQEVFGDLRPGEELVEQPFARMIERQALIAESYDGFWRCCDTFKDQQALQQLLARGPAPWELWRHHPPGCGPDLPREPARPAPASALVPGC